VVVDQADLTFIRRLYERGLFVIESRHAARRTVAPAGAKGWLRVRMCQIASVSLRESLIWASLGPRRRPRRRFVRWYMRSV
jgi:hypothetical protein